MEVIRIPSRAFPWSVFICCEEALTLHCLCWLRWGFPRVIMSQPKGSERARFRGVGKAETSSEGVKIQDCCWMEGDSVRAPNDDTRLPSAARAHQVLPSQCHPL